ncbi:MAG: DUF4833 domain-containing protein [Elusimicrobiota bacterium]|nr:DUF4833 domain-containing protein [Elusimicrobiota bacterium]
MKQKFLIIASLILILSSSAVVPFSAPKMWIKVFHIERSLNANICVYEVGVITSTIKSAIFDVSEPIKIYWIMYTKKGNYRTINSN